MAKTPAAAIPIAFDTLTALLGKTPDDPAVLAMIEKAGKVTVKSDFIIAKEAGFDFSLSKPPGAKKKVLSSLFLFADGNDKHRGYPGLPPGFSFGTRAALLAALPEPIATWKIGKGKVPVTTTGVSWDKWRVGRVEISASYGQTGTVGDFNVTLPEEEMGGVSLSTHPLHFLAKPADAPPDAERVGMGLLVAWAARAVGLPAKHAGTPLGKQLLAREITPRTFLDKACAKTLVSLDFDPKLGDFLYGYTHRLHHSDKARAEADKAIVKLLHLPRMDERYFVDDFLGTFDTLASAYHVPDSWDAVDRMAPVIDARWADFQATKFENKCDVKLYEKAAKLRDQVAVAGAAVTLAAGTADDALADDLIALIGKSLTDKHVKEVLGRAGLPIGKKTDKQANAALGLAYMGCKFPIGGKPQLGVDAVWFYAAKQTSHVRSIGAEVEFMGYPGKLPQGIAMGEARAAVTKKLGKPASTSEDSDSWQLAKDKKLRCEFAKGKLVMVRVGQPPPADE